MIGYLLRGSEGVYKPRSRVGLGKGSHSGCQRLVGLVIRYVQPAYERMGFVQPGAIAVCALKHGLNLYAPALPAQYRLR